MMKSHVFGPVPSRRLGRSLGIDLVPFKTCSYDCIYCQLGRTTHRTVDRAEWVPLDDVLSQVRDKLSTAPDYITLSGSGEPTLFSRLGALVSALKSMTATPVAVLTNGSLLWQPEVRAALAEADLLVPSLDAGDASLFQYVNRPEPSISFEQMIAGLIEMRNQFRKPYWLEVLLLGGVTAISAEMDKIAKLVKRIRPDRVQLNTATRPPAEEFAAPASERSLRSMARRIGPEAEVIADFRNVHGRNEFAAKREDVLELLQRRPCTVQDIAAGLAIHANEALKYVAELLERHEIRAQNRNGSTYYSA